MLRPGDVAGAAPRRPRGCGCGSLAIRFPTLRQLLVAALVAAAAAAPPSNDLSSEDDFVKLPADVPPCHRSDPKLNECIRHMFNSLMWLAAKGIPKLDVPPIDPLELPLMDLSELVPHNMTLRLLLHGVSFHGISDMTALSVTLNVAEGKLELVGRIPRLWLAGTFDAKGEMLHFPLVASGPFSFNMTDVSVTVIVYYREGPVGPGSPDFFSMDDLKMELAPVGISINFGDQLDGDIQLGETLNEFLNMNAHEIFSVVRVPASALVAKELRLMLDATLSAIPAQELLPD